MTQDRGSPDEASAEIGRGHPQDELTDLAAQTLNYFEHAVATAETELASDRSPSPNPFASINTLTGTALRTLADISEETRRNLEAVIAQPAIARVEILNEMGQPETIFVTPGGAPRGRWGDVRVASYRSPVGRLAAIAVGSELEIRTPSGDKSYELVGRARLRPERDQVGWDSRNTVIEHPTNKPLTVVSLRALIRLPEESDEALEFLNSLLQNEQNVFEGLRRSVLHRMELREQPLLDQYQDEIFRLPLNSRLAVLGPPGSGKTTTLIKRLGLKLDYQALEHEQALIERSIAGRAGHAISWLMFSPTELLRLYVKEAFNRERVPASDHQIQTWEQYRRETARNRLGILRSATSRGSVLRENLQNLQHYTMLDQIAWFEDFDQWQKNIFWTELREHAQRVAESRDSEASELGVRLLRIIEAGAGTDSADPFHEFGRVAGDVSKHATALRAAVDGKLRTAFARHLRQDPQLLNNLLEFIASLGEPIEVSEDIDDTDVDDDEDELEGQPRATREEAFETYMRAMRSQARALVVGRKIGTRSRYGRLVDWFGTRIPAEGELREIGSSVLLGNSLRRLANPLHSYLRGVPNRYRRFRRSRLDDGRWYERVTQTRTDLSPLELDVVMLAILKSGKMLLQDRRFWQSIDEPPLTTLRNVRDLLHTQIMVDEATDFSPIQIACMGALCDPTTQSFLACGDFNQRVTVWGTRSISDLEWAIGNIDIRTISVTYRHSRQLNALAHRLANLSDEIHEAAVLPEHMNNEGVDPILGIGLSETGLVAWLKDRIVEIEHQTRTLPSIAVLVNREADVQPLADGLQRALSDRNIQCSACPNGQVRGSDNDVRVFDVQHIKGLEFEAVFFVGIDDLANANPELFDKFIYVGATRAAMYLGLTTTSTEIPKRLTPLLDQFGTRWGEER